MKIDVITLDKEAKKYEPDVRKKARKLAKVLPRKGEIEAYLISGRRMRRLNKRFRKKDRSTNVLSFEKPKGFPGSKRGEVYLDPRYIRAHKEDMDLMLVHGVLHILGYDHERKSDRIKMEKREKALLSRIGN